MKILIIHNDYGKYSGEETVVDKMIVLLKSQGHNVVQLRKTSEGARESFKGQVQGFFSGIYSHEGVKAVRQAIVKEKPDIINIHNLYPFISPAALFECKKAGIPVIMTIHNFRLVCPTGLFMRNNQPCELCLANGNEWGCIKYNCEHSVLKSVGYATRNAVARITGAYDKCVNQFVCITDFQRKKLIEAGYDAEKITVIPNAVEIPTQYDVCAGEYVAFCGRLSREKGVDMILDVARRNPSIRFKFAGAVRDTDLVNNLPKNVSLTGHIRGNELVEFYKNAAFFVMASRWYEGFPMSILEAAQYGKATIGPDHGGFPEIIGKGLQAIGRLFTPGDMNDLEQQIIELWNSPTDTTKLGSVAFEKLKTHYSSEVIYQHWQSLFNDVTKNR